MEALSGGRAVISDLGGVLTPPPVQAVAEYLAGSGVSLDEVRRAVERHAHQRPHNLLVELELGRITEAYFLAIVGRAIELDLGRTIRVADFSDHHFSHLELNDELIDHLAVLRRNYDIRLAVLSNNAREWQSRWLAMPEFAMFEVFVNSAIVGVRKPDPAIYRLTLGRLGLPARACVFLDDLAANCQVAREVGMTAIRFIDTAQAVEGLDSALCVAA